MTVRELLSQIKGADQLPKEVLSMWAGESKNDRSCAAIKKFFSEAIANRREVADSEAFLTSLQAQIGGRLKRQKP